MDKRRHPDEKKITKKSHSELCCLLWEQINQFRAPREIINKKSYQLSRYAAADKNASRVFWNQAAGRVTRKDTPVIFMGLKISPKQLSWPTHSTRTFTALIWAIKLNWPWIFDLWQSRWLSRHLETSYFHVCRWKQARSMSLWCFALLLFVMGNCARHRPSIIRATVFLFISLSLLCKNAKWEDAIVCARGCKKGSECIKCPWRCTERNQGYNSIIIFYKTETQTWNASVWRTHNNYIPVSFSSPGSGLHVSDASQNAMMDAAATLHSYDDYDWVNMHKLSRRPRFCSLHESVLQAKHNKNGAVSSITTTSIRNPYKLAFPNWPQSHAAC